jgi:hypothetical protein
MTDPNVFVLTMFTCSRASVPFYNSIVLNVFAVNVPLAFISCDRIKTDRVLPMTMLPDNKDRGVSTMTP